MVYYNEIDPFAAEWLKNLMDRNLIAQGVVDTRSIVDVEPSDLTGFTQCHFFAGIGGWSRALRLAGWSDDRAVWSGSAPCQPFSSAGRQAGYDDERHLAPAWLRLVKECRPPVCFGEQVASAASNKKHPWLDDLQDELEAEGYATGALVLPACSVGGPHIRQRLWIVARRLADPTGVGLERSGCANSRGCSDGIRARGNGHRDCSASGGLVEGDGSNSSDIFWSNPDWLFCRDGKWRPVKSGAKPLVNGVPGGVVPSSDRCSAEHAEETDEARVGRLKGYGNAIVPQVAAEVIRVFIDYERFLHMIDEA